MTETRNPNQQDIENNIVTYADRLRAGLLDQDPMLKVQVKAALAAKPQADELWHTVREELAQHASANVTINHELRMRRREALRRAHRSRLPRGPWLQWATATACALAVVAGTSWYLTGDLTAPAAQQVAIDDVPELQELTENLDFYAWLDTQNATASTQSPR